MNILDLRTVLASYVISNTICALVIYSLWIQNRRRAPGLSFWLIDYLLQFVVLVLLVSRGTLPDFISITLPVPLILTGTLLLYIGLEQYIGRTSSQVYNYFFLALIVAIHLYFTFALPSLQARNLNYSVGLFVICVQVAWLMLRQVDAQVQPATRVVGITFAFYCLVSIIRFIIDWSVPSGNDLFQSGLYDTLAILTYQMLFIGLTFALFLMVNRRLFTALQHDITQRERAENALLESNAKLELLFETLPVGISILDREHHIVKQNQALVGILGMTAEGWARDDYRNRQYLRPDGSPMPPEEFASSRVLRGESAALNVETGVIKEDGAVVWTNVSAVASPLADWNTLIVTSDITARKRAEEALRESEALFKSFFEHAVEAMFLTLPDSHIVAANPAACQLFGWTEQELIAGGRAIVVDATDPRLPILLKERLEKGTAHGELTHRRRDGTTFQGEITSTIYRDRDGKQRTSMIVRDITEHKRAEMQVAQMNRLYATLSQVNQTIVRVKDRNDLFQSICDVAVQHGGFALAWVGLVDESTGNVNPVAANGLDVARWPFEIPTIHQEEPQSLVAWAIRTSTVVISEDMQTDQRIRAYHEPTRRFDHHSAAMVPFRLRGQIIGVLALISREIDSFRATQGVGLLEEMGLDISFALDTLENEAERQRAEQAVLESNTRFRTLFESSPDAIMLIDLHDNWHILDCNTTACQMNGYARDELIGQSIDLLNLQPTSPAERADYIERIQKNQILRLESFHRRKNGTTFPVEISTSIINLGEREILMGIDRDVSERKQAEEEHQHRIEQMTILNVAAIKLQQHHDPQEIIQVACDELQRLGTFASIYTVTADGNHLEHTYTAMTEKMLREYTSAFGKLQLNFSVPITLYGPAWERLEMGEAIFDTEIASQVVGWMTDEQRSIADWTLTHSNKSAMILAPLARDHAIIGLITILGDPWGASDLSGITLFARHVSVALENARLFNETRQRLQELEAINKISTALRRAKTIEEMLPILLQETLAILNAATGSIWLYDPAHDALAQVGELNFPHLPNSLTSRQGIAGQVFSSGKTYVSAEFKSDPLTMAEDRDQIPAGLGGACVPILAADQIIGVFFVSVLMPRQFTSDEVHLLTTITEIAGTAIHRTRLHEQTQQYANTLSLAYDKTIEGWSRALDLRDKETEGHSQRVTEMTVQLACELGIAGEQLVYIRHGALLHDIGKMGVPDSILLKPGTLDHSEWEIMRRHPELAYELLEPIDFLHPALDIPYCHHEKWDGTGYPRGLKGEEIPLVARIFAVVDVWDAVTSDRPYRPAWTKEKAKEYIHSEAGKHFDPKIVELFLQTQQTLEDTL